MIIASILIIGLIIGSFLNLCIIRIPQWKFEVSTQINCLDCGTRSKTFDLITLFMDILCLYRTCHQRISYKNSFVILISGLIPVLLYSKYGLSVDFAAFSFLMYILIIIFFIDLEHQIIPNELVIIAMFGGTVVFIYNLFRPFLIYTDHLWWNPLLGLICGSGFLLAVSFIGSLLYKTEEVMGMGDIKLFAPIGLFLGWRMTLLALFISVVLGGMISLLLILLGKATRKSTIPFGPFIVIGVFITVMWGWDIAYWYLHNFWYY